MGLPVGARNVGSRRYNSYPLTERCSFVMTTFQMNKQKRTPFFTRFLEKQELADVTGSKPGTTNKNKDEPVFVTLKYPSDSDETGETL
jgi:hypothetical protein